MSVPPDGQPSHDHMSAALDEARAALVHHDVPVGAVVVYGG